MKNHLFRRWLVRGALAAALALLGHQLYHLATLTPETLRPDDFIEFWSAARIALSGGNPYNATELMSLQQTVGWLESRPLMMWNPPWALALMLPFGLPGYSAGRVGWLMLHFGLVLFCADVSWRLYGLPTERRWVAWVLGITFIPTLWVLHLGQISPLMLLGVIGFLFFEQRRADWPAGFSLSLVLIKPQLLYLFVIASIIWALSRRRWFIILGMASALAIQVVTVLAVDPAVFTQYFAAWGFQSPYVWLTPTIGTALRLTFGWGQTWLQYLPPTAGTLWLLYYWYRKADTWQWLEETPILLLVSMTTTAYGWVYDQVLLLPAIIQVVGRLSGTRGNAGISVSFLIYGALNGAAMLTRCMGLTDEWRLWMAPSLLLLYLALRQMTRKTTSARPASPIIRSTCM